MLPGLKAVILVGGLGTRLRPLTNSTPKSMVPLLNRPFIEHTLAYLRDSGIQDIILTLNYLPEVIRGYLGNGSRYGVRLTYCMEAEPRGTAGAVKNAASYLDSTFLVFNGDIFTDIDLGGMVEYHLKNRALATISLIWVENPSAFGVVETDGQWRVRRFVEKPPPGTETTHWINAGVYVLEKETLQHVPADTHYMFERGLFPELLRRDDPIFGYTHRGYWLDMGNPKSYFTLNRDLILAKTNSHLYPDFHPGTHLEGEVVVHPSAVLEPPVMIGSGSEIGPGVRIKGPATIGRRCRLEENARVENSLLWDDIHVGKNCHLANSIVSTGSVLPDGYEMRNRIYTPDKIEPLDV